MVVTEYELDKLIPYAKNAKKHDKTQIANVAESIKQYGFVQPIVVDKDGVIVIGHCRALAAKKLGIKSVPCVLVDDLTPEQVDALRIVDNKTNESDWDEDLLREELARLPMTGFTFDFDSLVDEEEMKELTQYTMKVNIPQYEITGDCPEFSEMYDTGKTDELIAEIETSDITDEEKTFLIAAATRHTVFNYRNVAEYYAHATPEMQKLMEKSALVIIDVDDAIAYGFAKLKSTILENIEDES